MDSKKPSKLPTFSFYSERFTKWYKLHEFKSLGIDFISQIIISFQEYSERVRKPTFEEKFNALRVLFRWMIENKSNHPEFFDQLYKDYKELVINGQIKWEMILGYFRADFGMRDLAWSTKSKRIACINKILKNLEVDSILPYVEPIKTWERRVESKRSVAEVHRSNIDERSDVISMISDMGLESDDDQSLRTFIGALLDEGIPTADPKNFRRNVLSVLDKRLSDMRRAAEDEIVKEYAYFENGKRLLSLCDMDGQEIATRLETLCKKINKKSKSWREGMNSLFPNSDLGKARLLAYIDFRYNGIFPEPSYSHPETPFNDRIFLLERLLRLRLHWKISDVTRRLTASGKLLGAITVLILIDTSMNVECCRKLRRDALHDSDLEGYKVLTWWKPRSSGKELMKEIPVKDKNQISTVRAFEILLESNERVCEASLTDKNYCFCIRSNKKGKDGFWPMASSLVGGESILRWFKQMLSRHETLKHYKYTLDMIRPSKLLQVGLATGDPNAVKSEAQHAWFGTSMLYMYKIPEKLRCKVIMRNFMEWFQVLTTLKIENFAEKAGIDPVKYAEMAKDILKNHFGGIHCKDPEAGYNPDVPKGVFCVNIYHCLKCKGKRDIVLATTENMLSVMQWQEKLIGMKKGFDRTQEDLWNENWLLWEVFTETMLETWRNTPSFRPFFRKAHDLFKTAENPYMELNLTED